MTTMSMTVKQINWITLGHIPKYLLILLSVCFVISAFCTTVIVYGIYSSDEITIGSLDSGNSILVIRHNNTGNTQFNIARRNPSDPSDPPVLSTNSLSTRLGAILFPVALSIVFMVMILNNKDEYGDKHINGKEILVCGVIATVTFMIVGAIWHGM